MNNVAQMIRAANPVIDPVTALPDDEFEALLVLTKRRSGYMDVKEVRELETITPEKRSRRGLLVAAAAFLVVVGAAVLAVVLTGGGDEPDVANPTSIPLSGAEDDAEAAVAFLTVDAAYSAYNSGDMAAWVAANASADEDEFDESTLAKITAWREGEHVADGRIEVIGCRFDRRSPGITMRFVFSCDTTTTTALHSAAGMELAEVYEWVIDSEGTVVRSGSDARRAGLGVTEDDWLEFPKEFLFWLQSAHREVHNDMEIVEFRGLRQPTAASMPTALEYIDEYVAAGG